MEKHLRRSLWFGRFAKFWAFIAGISSRVFNYSIKKASNYTTKQNKEIIALTKLGEEPKETTPNETVS